MRNKRDKIVQSGSIPLFIAVILSSFSCAGDSGSSPTDTNSDSDSTTNSDTESGGDTDGDTDTSSDDEGDTETGSEQDTSTESDTGSDHDTGTETDCVPPASIVVDIDETLTTLDAEWWKRVYDASYDCAMRPNAVELTTSYADLGYTVFYVTARGEALPVAGGVTAREATAEWLVAHGFAFQPENLFLAAGMGALGELAVTYKTNTINGLIDQGWDVAYAYGNAETDIAAYKNVNIPNERIFLVGELAGTLDVQPIPDSDAYEQHLLDYLPTVPEVVCE